MLTTFFYGKALNKQLHPDEAVAIGATIQAGILAGSDEVADVEFKDVIPISIGMAINGPSGIYTVMSKIIQKNSKFPSSETKTYYDQGAGGFEVRVL